VEEISNTFGQYIDRKEVGTMGIIGKLIIGLVIAVFFLVATSAYPGAAQAKVFKLDLACTLPLGTAIEKTSYKFRDLVKEKTGGQVLVSVYPAGQLYKDKDLVEVIPKGALGIGTCNMDFWTGRNAGFGIITGNTFIFDDYDHYWRWEDEKKVRAAVDGALKKLNCKLLSGIDYGTAQVIAKKELRTPADWKGAKIRSYGELCATAVEALGGRPTVISSAEQYDALMKGVVDGCMTGPPTFVVRKLYEGAKYVMRTDLGFPEFLLIMNLDLFNSMPGEIQKKVLEAAREAELWGRKVCLDENNEWWRQLEGPLKEKWGLKVYTLTPAEFKVLKALALPAQKERMMRLSPDLTKTLLETVEATHK